jgi:hypothetical protein
MKQSWLKWVDGFVNAALGGLATGFVAVVVSPASFDPKTQLGHLATVCAVSAALCAVNYLKQSPLPIAPETNSIPPAKQ